MNSPQSLVTNKMFKKDLVWLALTGVDKCAMEFSLNARRVNEAFLFEQTAQILCLLTPGQMIVDTNRIVAFGSSVLHT